MPALSADNILQSRLRRQRGAALMVMLVIIVMGSLTFLVSALSRARQQAELDKISSDALAQAKDGLISYAASVTLTSSGAERPGDLPCPDLNNDGTAEANCGSAAGSLQYKRLGRLPWKTLRLPDLRDSSGERLWYAVSNNFKKSTRTSLLNSDTPGTITIRSSDGNVVSDAGSGKGVVAVIFAPGSVLQRQGDTTPQNRGCIINVNCDSLGETCTASPPTLTPKCQPSNYLDIATIGSNTEDNADFADSTSNGFIQGMVKDISGKITIINDQIISITQDDIMQAVQKRVAGEVRSCLQDYASLNNGRYPWAVPLGDLTNYLDQSDLLFGRIPDDLSKTKGDSGNVMAMQWGGGCQTHSNNTPSTWWQQWRELVFYGLADAYKPVNPPGTPPTCAAAGACLSVNPTSTAADKEYVVIVAGKMLSTQISRSTNRSTLSNYLEPPNSGGTTTFSQGAPSASFNDTVAYKQ